MVERSPLGLAGLTFLLALSWVINSKAADNQDTIPVSSSQTPLDKLGLGGYGAANYYHFKWQTDSSKRDAIDLPVHGTYNWTRHQHPRPG